MKPVAEEPLECQSTVDVILMIDGSGSMTQEGFDKTKKMAKVLVSAFEGKADAEMSVILFSGPRTWSGFYACISDPNVDVSATCGITTAQHFTSDMQATIAKIDALSFPASSTFTSMALDNARTEVDLSRPDVETVLVLFTDGKPLSDRWTKKAAKKLKKKGVRIVVTTSQIICGACADFQSLTRTS